MNRRSGQTTVEMAFLMPLLVMVIGGSMFILYACWQGIKTQQAANFAARVQGQERVAGGTDLGAIAADNGNTASQGSGGINTLVNSNLFNFNTVSTVGAAPGPSASGDGVYGKINRLVRALFPGSSAAEVHLQPPVIGQNVDTVSVVRTITMPRLPFLNDATTRPQVTIQATAYGGEDTFMYGLPRWGRTGSSSDAEWKTLVNQKGDSDQ